MLMSHGHGGNVFSGREMGVTDFVDSRASDKPVHEVVVLPSSAYTYTGPEMMTG